MGSGSTGDSRTTPERLHGFLARSGFFSGRKETQGLDGTHTTNLKKCHTEMFPSQPRTGTYEDIFTWHREQLKSRTPSPLRYGGQPLVSVVLVFR